MASNHLKISIIFLILFSREPNIVFAQPNQEFNQRVEKLWNYQDNKRVGRYESKDTILGYKSKLPLFLKAIQSPPQKFTVNPLEPMILSGEKGFKIEIPAHSFRLPQGFPKGNKISIFLIEITEPVDLITSGIDMSFIDSKGKPHLFESGGMYKLEASYNARRLALKPGVRLTATAPYMYGEPESMNVYELDPRSDSWKELGKEETREEMFEGEGSIIHRFFNSIKNFNWINFDYPNPDTTCLTGGIIPMVKDSSITVYVVGVDYLGYTSRGFSNNEFAMNTVRNKKVKIIAVDSKGNIAKSEVLKTSGNKQFIKENKKVDQCMNIGKLKLEKPDPSIWKNKKEFKDFIDI